MNGDTNNGMLLLRQRGSEEQVSAETSYKFAENFIAAAITATSPTSPRLAVFSSGVLVIPRPTNATSFSLQQNAALLPTNWAAGKHLVTGLGRQNRATVQTAGDRRFFRLTSTRARQFGQGASVLSNAPFPELFSRLEKRTLTFD